MRGIKTVAGGSSRILDPVRDYYTKKVEEHGPVFRGVDWNSAESQELRFEQLLRVCERNKRFSINDYGCGYGGLYRYMKGKGFSFDYHGLDVSGAMIKEARKAFGRRPNASFRVGGSTDVVADYTVASGIFNVRLGHSKTAWLRYILKTVRDMDRVSRLGFSFNCLTRYSDREYMKGYLYYADPCYLFDYCKRRFSKSVALLHDYGLYEFTMVVRK
ncbi:MAG: methyltransferase domain-containing protein [Deltaproteobacteria bacterium]|nr:methyltransferase domain-containing protein [Deltaproteobacteria bacterium]